MQHLGEKIEEGPLEVEREHPSTRRRTPNPGSAVLAVAVTTKDNIRSIRRTLESVRPVADRIVVVDSGSSDGTCEVCRELGAEVVHRDWTGHVDQKQFAVDRCADARWVLLLDSDESLEPSLQQSIRAVVERDDSEIDGWRLRRKTWFLGGWLHRTYQPEWRLRLVRPRRSRVVGTSPHDRMEVQGRTGRLDGVLRHDSWADVSDLATRQVWYAELVAKDASRGGGVLNMLISPPAAMLKQLVIKRGFLDGRRGLIVAGLTFNATMLKHAFIAARRLETKARREAERAASDREPNGR